MAVYNTGVTGSATNITAATAFTFTVPAGVLTGDVMIVSLNVFSFSSNTFGISVPSSGGGSWTQIGTTQPGNQGSIEGWGSVWYRIATASDPGSTFTVSWTGTSGGGNQFWWASDLEAYTGFYTAGTPIGNFQATVVNATSVTCPSVTTSRDNSWGVFCCPSSISGSGTITGEPTTNRHVINPGAGVDNAISDTNGSAGVAGSTIGGGSFTFNASSSGAGIAFTVELYSQAPAGAPVEAPTPPRIPHPLWFRLLEVAQTRADWQAQGVATPVPATWRLMDGVNGRPGVGSTGTQPPASATSNGVTPQVNGLSFYVTQGGTWFQGFWYYCCASGQSTSPAKFALWSYQLGSGTGKLVPGTTVTSGTLTAGAWNFVPLAQPVQLAIWGVYVAQVGIAANAGYPDTASQFGSSQPYSAGIVNGPLTAFSSLTGSNAPAGGNIGQCPWTSSGGDPAAVLAGSDIGTNDNIWLDVQITNAPPAGYNGSYRLWPNMYDADIISNADAAVNYVIGTDLVLSQACVLNAIWYYVPAGMGSSGNQWATSADVWRVSDQVRVATQPSPVWINPWTGGVDGQSNAGRWVYTQMPGTVYLQPGEYRISVYNNNGSPNGWGSKRTGYWESINPGYGPATSNYQNSPPGQNGITNGPLYAPPPPLSSPTVDYNTSAAEPGQSVFAVGPPNQYPNLYVGPVQAGVAVFQNYWIDAEVTPASTFTPDAPDLPQRLPHPLYTRLLEVAAYRSDASPPPIAVSGSDSGAGADSAYAGTPVQAYPVTPPGRSSPQAWQFQANPSQAPLLVPVSDSDTGTGTDSASAGTPVQAWPLTPPGRVSPMAARFQANPSQAPLLVPVSDSDTGTGTDSASATAGNPGTTLNPPGRQSPMAWQFRPLTPPPGSIIQVSDSDSGGGADSAYAGTPVQAYPVTPPGRSSPQAWQFQANPSQAPLLVPVSDSDTGTGTDSASAGTPVQAWPLTPPGRVSPMAARFQANPSQAPLLVPVSDSDSGTGTDSGTVTVTAGPPASAVLVPPGPFTPMNFRRHAAPSQAPQASTAKHSAAFLIFFP